MLLELSQKLMAKARQSESSGGLPIGSITRDAEYDQLHYAEVLDLAGTPIGTATIDRTGDIVGMSPGERCTLNGETAWMPLERLRNFRTTPFQPVTARGTLEPSAEASTPVRARKSHRAKKATAAA